MAIRQILRRPRTWIIAVPVLVLLVAVVGPFVYINFIEGDPPERLTLDDGATTTTGATQPSDTVTTIAGTWSVGTGSRAGYRVDEVLFGQDTEAVGRTDDVTGNVAIDETTVGSATFTVDLKSVSSDQTRRDNQFHGRIMDTDTHPNATFELTRPIVLESAPANLTKITVQATGRLTLRGTTRPVTFDLAARRNGDTIEVNGSIPVRFADYGIPDASFGPATVDDHGEIEFLLVLRRAG